MFGAPLLAVITFWICIRARGLTKQRWPELAQKRNFFMVGASPNFIFIFYSSREAESKNAYPRTPVFHVLLLDILFPPCRTSIPKKKRENYGQRSRPSASCAFCAFSAAYCNDSTYKPTELDFRRREKKTNKETKPRKSMVSYTNLFRPLFFSSASSDCHI